MLSLHYVKYLTTNDSSEYHYRYDFEKANISGLSSFLNNINWNIVLDTPTIDESVEIFYEYIYAAFDFFVPVKVIRSSKYPIWFNQELKRLTFLKKLAHLKYKRSKSQNDYNHFSNLRSHCKRLSKYCHKDYITRMESTLLTEPKKFRNCMNSQRKESRIPNVVSHCGITAINDKDIANLFRTHFNSVYIDNGVSNLTNFHDLADSGFFISSFEIDEKTIFCKLRNLDVTKGPGPDDIPPSLLKWCCSSFLTPLYILFNKSLKSGTFPFEWKKGIVVPVFKDGDMNAAVNYRPITLLSAIPKIFESIVHDTIYAQSSHLIIEQQHGFVKKKKCINQYEYFY